MLLLALLAACNNPCQQVCDEMAIYAKECGYSVPDGQLDDCHAAWADVDAEQADACVEAGDPEKIREWWSCEQVAQNFQDGV